MIYTATLTENTSHVLIYDKNTPVCVMSLYITFVNEKQWIEHIDCALRQYSEINNIPYENLSAKPIKHIEFEPSIWTKNND